MKLSYLFFGNQPDEKWALSRQMGIKHAIAKLAPELTGDLPPSSYASLKRSKETFNAHGFELTGLEGDQFDMNRIKFGQEGRDEDIRQYQQMLRNMGRLGIHLLCYNFMAGIGWYRTRTDIPERGGAWVSGFDRAESEKQGNTPFGPVSAETIWENYRYFISQVLPVAEEAGVHMALHPDDPPVSPLRGIGRIFISAEGVDQAMQLSNSPSHGITFCQGTFSTMGEDISKLATRWKDRIRFIHFRDVTGTPDHFRETFHDNGPGNMVQVLQTYQQLGLDLPIRSDHVPAMAGEQDGNHAAGYGIKGNLFGIGYMKGLMEALDIPLD